MTADRCSWCGAPVEWRLVWRVLAPGTAPKKRLRPCNPGTLVQHVTTCPKAK